jgi:hypothetical protein
MIKFESNFDIIMMNLTDKTVRNVQSPLIFSINWLLIYSNSISKSDGVKIIQIFPLVIQFHPVSTE